MAIPLSQKLVQLKKKYDGAFAISAKDALSVCEALLLRLEAAEAKIRNLDITIEQLTKKVPGYYKERG